MVRVVTVTGKECGAKPANFQQGSTPADHFRVEIVQLSPQACVGIGPRNW